MKHAYSLGCVFALLTAVHFASPLSAQETQLTIGSIKFVDHITAGMIEQDALIEKEKGSGKVYRIGPDEAETYKDAPVFGTAEPIHHAPFAKSASGPYPKGKALGVTLSEWLSGSGTASYSCTAGEGSINASFTGLVPDGVYTMWYAFAGKAHMGCADCPFSTIDFPVGGGDGSQSVFSADGSGNADFQANFSPCLRLGDELLMPMLAIAYHSDGNTYGPDPGKFGTASHVQLFAGLPDQNSWAMKK